MPPGKTAIAAPAPTWPGPAPPGAIRTACRRRCGDLLDKELALIEELGYPNYFLTVHDIVAWAREPGHPLPGPRLGGQFVGLLLPGRHRRRSLQARPRRAVRALHLQGARRAARHRRRLRARAARAGDAVRLRALWPPPRRHLRHRHPLPAAQRHPRRRQGAGADRGHHRRAGQHRLGQLGRRRARRPHPPGRASIRPIRRSAAPSTWPPSCSAFRATCRSTSAASC